METVYLTAAQVRVRFGGVSDMALWRWINSPTTGFPKPVKIGQRRYFRLDEIEAFEEAKQQKRGAA